MQRVTIRSALSGLILVLGVVLTFMIAVPISALLPDLDGQAALPVMLALMALCCGGAAALWGNLISRISGSGSARSIATASAVSYAFALILAVVLLGLLEPIIVQEQRFNLPIHIAFTLLFVPATWLVCALVGGAIGVALGDLGLAARLAWRAGLAGGLAFLALDGLQDALGRRVGGPNAAETATMLTVTLVGMLGAAIAASATIGRTLAAWRGQVREQAAVPEAA